VISGVPTRRGRSTFTVEARNGAGTAALDAGIDVLDGPAFTNGQPPAGTVGLPYDFALQVTGHPEPTFTVTGGTLPSGLTLDAHTGRIVGVPTEAGSSLVTVRAGNGVGPDISTTFTMSVAAASSATVLTVGDTSTPYGSSTTARILVFATGARAEGTVTLNAGSTPVGSAALAPDPAVPGMSAATVAIEPRTLPPGVHVLSAGFAGNARVLASQDTRSLTVTKAVPRVTATVRRAKRLTVAVRGRMDVTVRAAGVPRPGGRIVVRDDGRKVGTARVAADGTATIRLSRLRAGKRTLTVTYSGTSFVAPGPVATVKVRVRRR